MAAGNHQISSGYLQVILLAVLSFLEIDRSHLESDHFPLKMYHINYTWSITSIYKTRPRKRTRSGDTCMVLNIANV